jgi:CRISPR/Cas system endoribonuclease Cas6 (RAMP superfamily)
MRILTAFLKALEYTQSMDKLGSLIISTNEETKVGGLYLGGYRPSINREFLLRQHVTHILNAAAGLVNFFGPKYEVRKRNHSIASSLFI